MNLTLIVPGDPAQRTGGYLYDARIVEALRQRGWSIEVRGLEGRFPVTDARAASSMDETLQALPEGHRVLIDGLALGGLPEVAAAHAQRLRLIALVHHPLGDETGLQASQRRQLLRSESRALAHCRELIVTSPFTARRLAELGLAERPARVVEPGVERAELAPRVRRRLEGRADTETEQLLCVASLSPRKGQDLLVEALAGVREQAWHCRLVGSPDRDPDFAARVQRRIEDLGLAERIELTGEADEIGLKQAYLDASVCILPSWYEGYGMVISEALARGLPLISTTGGALAETVPESAALRVEPGNASALRRALERWLTDPGLRLDRTRAAVRQRDTLSDWPQAGERFERILRSVQ